MKKTIIKVSVIFSLSLLVSCGANGTSKEVNDEQTKTKSTEDLTIKESSFCKALSEGTYILPSVEGWWNWCMAPMYDKEGKVHVFMSTIPKKGRWSANSKIVHFVADQAEGPYEFVDTAFASTTAAYHNPQISKVGDTYVMVYLWKLASTKGINQSIGIATTKSLDEPWTESPNNPIIKPSLIEGSANAQHASNPTFVVAPDGEFRVYYKSISDKYLPKNYREISLATSDNIEGPYVNHPNNPLISFADRGLDIEDPYVFYYEGMYQLIVEDRMDVKSALEGKPAPTKVMLGGRRPGLLFKSEDGITWDRPEIGYNTNSHYFDEKISRTERPHILWKDGKPDYLFLANHSKNTAGFVLKVGGKK